MIFETIQSNDSLITLGRDAYEAAFRLRRPEQYSSIFVVSQVPIWQLHGAKMEHALQALGLTFRYLAIADGEEHKHIDTLLQIVHWLGDSRADRHSVLIVLGGGVVGDMAGFAAATYMRGIDWFYCPTTLLAQQDASVGGKTAINLPHGKNMMGHFWAPKLVAVDASVLATLPPRELNAGYMEWLKHGMLEGRDLLEAIVQVPADTTDYSDYVQLLAQGLKLKIRVVTEDPFEKGLRRTLNLGHTFGHAIERFMGYGTLLHGEAVGIGLIFASLLGQARGGTYDWNATHQSILARLPRLDLQRWDCDTMLDLTLRDKKGNAGVISWIVPYAPGEIEIVAGVDRQQLMQVYDAMMGVLQAKKGG